MMLTRRIVATACALCLAIPAAAGASQATDPPKLVEAKGPYGMTLATDPPNLVKAIGPFGMTSKGPHATTQTTPHAASASTHEGTSDWRTAAISEAALLAALAVGSALLTIPRRRAPRLGT
jgi:hypothetical protein